MSFTSLVDLSAQAAYRSFYVPHFEIRVNGAVLQEPTIQDVLQITYKDNVKEIDSVDLIVNNWDEKNRRFIYIGSETSSDLKTDPRATLFEPNPAIDIEVWLGYVGALRLVSTVNIVSLEPSFSGGGSATLQVRGLNALHKLRTKQHSYAWTKKRPSEIAKSLGELTDGKTKRLPIPVHVDDKSINQEPVIDYLAQDNEYDIDFLLNLARREAFDLTMVPTPKPGFLVFERSKLPTLPANYQLVWGQTLIDFKPRLTTSRQIGKATVKGWDRQRKKPISVTVDLSDREIKKINPDLQRLVLNGGREEQVVNEPVFNEQQARDRARAILLDQMKQIVTADGTTVGLPDLRAGSRLDIEGVGSRLSGQYFVTETIQSFSDAGYTTKFKARRENAGAGA
ncbi:MAG: phage late control D family protein [Rhodopila sp.]